MSDNPVTRGRSGEPTDAQHPKVQLKRVPAARSSRRYSGRVCVGGALRWRSKPGSTEKPQLSLLFRLHVELGFGATCSNRCSNQVGRNPDHIAGQVRRIELPSARVSLRPPFLEAYGGRPARCLDLISDRSEHAVQQGLELGYVGQRKYRCHVLVGPEGLLHE